MNSFDVLAAELMKSPVIAQAGEIRIDEPAHSTGRSFLTAVASDGYSIEVEWTRSTGFGVAAGYDLAFGAGVDEIYGSAEATAQRVVALFETRESTENASPVSLPDLRKLRGVMQKQVAEQLGISKSGVAQLEKPAAVETMQIATLKKLVSSLGGELVVKARFNGGGEREIAID